MISSRFFNGRFWPILLLIMLLLAACSAPADTVDEAVEIDNSSAETNAEESAEEPVAEEIEAEPNEETAAASETRTITDAMGREVAIPVNPQRVVTLSEIDTDSLLALGIVPVGAPNGRGQTTLPTYLQPMLEGHTTAIGGIGEPNLETILTLEPDLIIYSDPYGPLAERIPELEQIAPVVVPYVFNEDWHWKTVFQAVAGALDKTAEAEAWLQAYDERAAELGALLPAEVVEVSIVRWMADGPRILLSNAFSSQVLSDVGFERPQYQLDLAGTHPVHTDVISMEQIELVDADMIFAGGLNPEGDDAMDVALADPLVQTLSAVQAGRIFLVDGLAWSSTGGPIAALEVLDDVENALTEVGADAGDGETAVAENSALPRTVTDVNGDEVVIADDSAVIALDGPLTEIVYALGAEDRLVATDVSSVYPEAATQLPQVGYVRSLSAEPVLALAPTLVLTTDSAGPPEALAQLQESGVTLALFKAPETIEDSIALVRSVAAALGKEAEGEEIVAQMEADLAEAADLLAQTEGTPRVMFIYARGLDTVSAAGYGTSIDVMFELAGVENAITEWEGYQPLTAEGAVTAAPDALLLFTSGLESVGGSEGLLGVPGIAETPAGAEGRIYDMDGLLLTGLGPRVGEAVIELIQLFHPEVAP